MIGSLCRRVAGDERDTTSILLAHRQGEPGAIDALFERVYHDLRRIARANLARHAARPLDTTSLVHELYLKLVDQSQVDWQDRSHFLGIAARAMRQVIVDFARRINRKKRGGGKRDLPLDPEQHAMRADAERVLALDDALGRLGSLDPRLTQLVELRFFVGFSEQEAADVLGLSLRSVQRDWTRAKALLREILDVPAPRRPFTP